MSISAKRACGAIADADDEKERDVGNADLLAATKAVSVPIARQG